MSTIAQRKGKGDFYSEEPPVPSHFTKSKNQSSYKVLKGTIPTVPITSVTSSLLFLPPAHCATITLTYWAVPRESWANSHLRAGALVAACAQKTLTPR